METKIKLNELKKMIRQIAKEETHKNKFLTYKKIIGKINEIPVVAYVYPNEDSGLNHYRINGKTFMGTVEFTSIFKEEEIEY